MTASQRNFLTAALMALAGLPAAAAPLFGGDELQRNGAVSRHLWTPDCARGQVAGVRLSAGLALGLSDPLHGPLGRRVTPALKLQLDSRSSLSLLPGNGRGTMLVLQTAH
jgi:hypothetical protein